MPSYTLIIDTNRYAGNFERDMCAFITGQIGDCTVGKEYVAAAQKELEPHWAEWFDEHIVQRNHSDKTKSYRCERPCEMVPSPSRDPSQIDERSGPYDSVAIFLNKQPTPLLIQMAMERARAFAALKTDTPGFSVLGMRLTKGIKTVETIDIVGL